MGKKGIIRQAPRAPVYCYMDFPQKTPMSTPPVIGYVLKGYPRISETFISNEILQLERLGLTLRLFSMRHPRENFSHASIKQIRARVDYLPTELLFELPRLLIPNIFLAVKQPERFRKALRLASERYRRSGSTATVKHLLQGGYMANNFLLRHPEIRHLHAHFAHSPTSVAMFASLLSALPFSFTAHAKDIYTSDARQLREKIDKARFVVTCTRHNKEYLSEVAGNSATPIHCIYHGIDLELFHHAQQTVVSTPPYRLLTVARMTEKKGLPTLYRALAILKKQGVEFEHILIGDGDDRERILELIHSLELDGHCHWLGTRTHEEVLGQYRRSDLFVLSCEIAENGDRDGIPNVLVESLAMGVPALSTTVSAIPEILQHGRTGYTVPSAQPQQLAEAMILMLQDQDLRRQLISQGKAWVREQFDNRKWIENLARLFRSQPHLNHCCSDKSHA